MSFRFDFDELRATQAAAQVVQFAQGKMNYLVLIKILYLADRESLKETGTTITGASFCNMEHGPVLSQVLDCVKDPRSCPIWNKHFAKSEYEVSLQCDPGDSELSDFDSETLRRLAQQFHKYSYSQMIDYVHKLPEWKDPGKGAKEWLDPSEVLRANDVDDRTIKEFEGQNCYMSGVQRMLGQ